jgi:hypothetical protein
MNLFVVLLGLLGLLCTASATPFGAESATEAFISHFSDHVQSEMESLLRDHILRDIDRDLNETVVRDALVSDLGPALSDGFRPHILTAFEKVEKATKVSKNPRKIRESAKMAFEELQLNWIAHSAKTMDEWSERHPDLAESLGKPSLQYQKGSELIPLRKRRVVFGGFGGGGVWDMMMKTIITWEFIGILFSVFAMIGALFSGLGRNEHRRHAHVVFTED